MGTGVGQGSCQGGVGRPARFLHPPTLAAHLPVRALAHPSQPQEPSPIVPDTSMAVLAGGRRPPRRSAWM